MLGWKTKAPFSFLNFKQLSYYFVERRTQVTGGQQATASTSPRPRSRQTPTASRLPPTPSQQCPPLQWQPPTLVPSREVHLKTFFSPLSFFCIYDTQTTYQSDIFHKIHLFVCWTEWKRHTPSQKLCPCDSHPWNELSPENRPALLPHLHVHHKYLLSKTPSEQTSYNCSPDPGIPCSRPDLFQATVLPGTWHSPGFPCSFILHLPLEC